VQRPFSNFCGAFPNLQGDMPSPPLAEEKEEHRGYEV